jgi:hypothetical protein
VASRNRYRPFVSSKGPQEPPHQPDPAEGDAPLTRMADEQDDQGGPMQVPRPPPGVGKRAPTRRPAPVTATDPEEDDDAASDEGGGDDGDDEDERDEDINWLARAQAAYLASTSFADQNYRKKLEDSLRAFNNQHPSDSKYNSETFRKRSNLYRPKIRTVIRKNEAALCTALFSNLDLIECTAANPSDQNEIVSAEVMQQLLQERLTVSMPWYQFVMGSMQDASNQGWVICHSYWKHIAYTSRAGEYKVREDKPCQELVPLENFLFDPAAAWYDIVGTSPYLIHAIPMYVGAVKERMKMPDPKGRKWKELSEDDILSQGRGLDQSESTRTARTGMADDPTQQQRGVRDYDIVWVFRHIHREAGEDYEFYMLGRNHMLTEPEPLEDNVWFGERPYVVGTCMLETHKPIPNSLATLLRPLADEANDLQNQSSDNMKFILNKAWFVKRSANVDTTSLVRNVPGRVTMVNDPDKDVKEVNWPDLPASVSLEKNRNDQDFDSLAGSFNPMMLQATRNPRESYRTVNAVQTPAMMMTEYTLMTLVQTFLLPVLRQLVLMEQHYETDQVLLALAGQRAQLLQKYGVDKVTDAILEKKMTVNVNLGMGATDPTMKQQRLQAVLVLISQLTKQPIPGLDLQAVMKELFALAGYRDAMRFMATGQDPEKVQMQKTIQVLMMKLQKSEVEKGNRHESNVVKLITSREANEAKLLLAAHEKHHEDQHLLVGHLLDLEKQDRAYEQQMVQPKPQGGMVPPAAPGAPGAPQPPGTPAAQVA